MTKKVNNYGFQIVRPLLKVYLCLVQNPKVIHKERIPKKEGFLFAGTHKSYFDPFVVANSTHRTVHFLAKRELFDNKFLGPVMNFMGVIKVDRKAKSNPEAKKDAIECLKDNKVVCVFPEATRNLSNDSLLPFKYGAVSIARKSGKPIVPFAIIGNPKHFNYKVKIIIGKPYTVESDDLDKENRLLMQKVLDLIEEGKKYDKSKRTL